MYIGNYLDSVAAEMNILYSKIIKQTLYDIYGQFKVYQKLM